MTLIDFTLSALNVNILMSASGEVLKIPSETIISDATAEYYVKTTDLRNVFMFQTDSNDIDSITNNTDIKYFVRKNQWPTGLILNPCHAWVQSTQQIAGTNRLGNIPDYKELVKHDFIRHIAKSLFNTHLAVDLFSNEDELKYDLAYKGYYNAWGNIWSSINNISDLSLNQTTYLNLFGNDPSYGYYLTNDCSNNTNISRQLLNQIIKDQPSRLQNLNTYSIDASNGYYLLPLLDGDSIVFKLTLQSTQNQHLLLNKSTPIPERSYKIRINLKSSVTNDYIHSDGVNVIPHDLKPKIYNGNLVTETLNNRFTSNYTRVTYMNTSGLWFDYVPKINLYMYTVFNSSGAVAYTPDISAITKIVKGVKMSSDVTSYMNKGLLTSVVNNTINVGGSNPTNAMYINNGRLFNESLNVHTIGILNEFPLSSSQVGTSNNKPNWIFRFSFIFKPQSTSDNKFFIDMGAITNRTGVYAVYIINVENMNIIQFEMGNNNWNSTLTLGGRYRELNFTYIPNNRYLVFMFMTTSMALVSNGISDMMYRWKYSATGTYSGNFSQFDYPIFNY